jgi:hypothetical protein
MDSIILSSSETSPAVHFDAALGRIELSGRSIPEDASAFYFPLLDWLEHYSESPAPKTQFVFYLEYINSISQKMLIDIFLKAQKMVKSGQDVNIVWYYDEEDEEMYEEGSVFRNKLELPMEIKVKE